MTKHRETKCYYLVSGTNTVESAVFSHTETWSGRRLIVRYKDGGWNEAAHNFFTVKQCREYHGLLPHDGTRRKAHLRRLLAAAESKCEAAAAVLADLQHTEEL